MHTRFMVIPLAVILFSLIGVKIKNNGIIFLPVVASQTTVVAEDLLEGYVADCKPSPHSTLLSLAAYSNQGTLTLSNEMDGVPIYQSDLGELILSLEGPLAGNWWTWLADAEGNRLSKSVSVRTESEAGLGKCQHATISFHTAPFHSQPVLAPLAWDGALSQKGVYAEPARVQSGENFWHLIDANWENEQEANGEGRIYVEVLNANGQREVGRSVTIFWKDGSETQLTVEQPGAEYALYYPMSLAGNVYSVRVEGYPSDTLIGAGLGTPGSPSWHIHTNIKLKFQFAIRP